MLELIDGPCKGTFFVKRAPVYLRCVKNQLTEEIDVLDQLEDTPQGFESVYVYKLQGDAGWMHIRGTKIHGFYALGKYKYLPEVDGEVLRDNSAWQAWAMSQNLD